MTSCSFQWLIYVSVHCAATVAKDFVGGTQLKTTGGKTEEVKTAKPATTGASAVPTSAAKTAGIVTTPEDDVEDTVLLPGEKDVQPVGKFHVKFYFCLQRFCAIMSYIVFRALAFYHRFWMYSLMVAKGKMVMLFDTGINDCVGFVFQLLFLVCRSGVHRGSEK